MIQHIFKQLWTQRKYNTWIYIELVVIFVLVWVLVDYAFVLAHNRSIPKGFDTTDTYLIKYGIFGNETSRYNATESDSVKVMDNLDLFVRKIKEYKNVEIAALTNLDWGSLPFSGSYNSTEILINDTTTGVFAEAKTIFSGDFFRIFRYTSTQDNSWTRPASIDMRQNNPVFITRKVEREVFGNGSAIGKTIRIDVGEGLKDYVVADVLNDQKRFDYDLPAGAVFGSSPLVSPNNLSNFGVSLRVKPGTSEQKFIADFRKEMTKQLRIGNFYLKDIQSFRRIKEDIDYTFGKTNEIRTRTALMIFFLLNIALGIIGTFWFRNQTRRGEIGLRMALGSTRTKLQWQFILEALLLLTLAVFPAVLINYAIVEADVIKIDIQGLTNYKTVEGSPYIIQNAPLRFLAVHIITYVFLAIIIVFSAWIPANKASKVHPVDALRDE